MSFILDALRKSEKERRAIQAPDLNAVLQEPVRRRRPWFRLLGLLLVSANLGGLAFWAAQLPSGLFKVAPRTEPSPPELPNSPPSPASRVPGGLDRASAPESPLIRAPDVPSSSPAAASERPAPRSEPSRARVVSEEDDPMDQLLEAEMPRTDPVSQPKILLSRSGLPLLEDLPASLRERIPPFKITMLAYDEDPKERFVIVNLQKRRVGDFLPGGVLLIEIRSEDLVGELDGQKFRISRF